MLEQLSKLLIENEKLNFSVESVKDGFKVIVTLQPVSLKLDVPPKPATLKGKDGEEFDNLTDVINSVRAELAKPKVITGSIEEIGSDIEQLLELKESQAYEDAENLIETSISSLEEIVQKAKAKKASAGKSKTTAKKTTGTKTTAKAEPKAEATKGTSSVAKAEPKKVEQKPKQEEVKATSEEAEQEESGSCCSDQMELLG